MSFLISCPNCGSRSVYEFRYGGEYLIRPAPDGTVDEWTRYVYLRANPAGLEREWWFHRDGCRTWFQAERDKVTNRVVQTFRATEGPRGSEKEVSRFP